MRPKLCPCHSAKRYAECCAPYHDGTQAPATCEALMRSRYAAFSLGLGSYLVQTLAPSHEDLALPREALVRSLSQAKDQQRFMGLAVLHTEDTPAGGTVLFYARIFVKGKDRSFAEHSQFLREDGALKYASGTMLETGRLPKDPGAMSLAQFEELLRAT
jgi:SEC-C motif domain protein